MLNNICTDPISFGRIQVTWQYEFQVLVGTCKFLQAFQERIKVSEQIQQ